MPRYVFASILIVLLSCQKDQRTTCDSNLFLRDVAPFSVGTTDDNILVTWGDQTSGKHFNRISTENILKMENMMPRKDSFNFWRIAWMAREAMNSKFTELHAHPVIWHNQIPDWLPQLPPDELKDLMLKYCNAYRGNLEAYSQFVAITGIDVVNEALNEDGSLRRSFWYEAMGRDYIRLAFQEFSGMNPETKLFYNDYNLALNPKKLDAALDLCDWLRSTGVRVDGIGMQMHIDIHEPSQVDIAAAFQKIIDRGYMVHVSELDVSINPRNTETSATPALLSKQADVYAGIFRLYNQLPKKYRYGITVWGYSDAESWIQNEYQRFDAPLLINVAGMKKPAYCACLNTLNQ